MADLQSIPGAEGGLHDQLKTTATQHKHKHEGQDMHEELMTGHLHASLISSPAVWSLRDDMRLMH